MATDPSASPNSAPDPTTTPAYNREAGYLNSEARRTLASPVYGTAPSAVSLPRDTVIKRMLLKMIASTSVTYASGSPLTSNQGIFDRLCSYIEVNVNGNRLIKGVRPHLLRMHNILINEMTPRRSYQTSAGAPTVTRAGREWFAGTVAYPATTQFFLFNEAVELYFENPFGYGGSRYLSELDVRNVSSADIRFNWQPFTNLLQDGNGATVTYGTTSCVVIPQIVENRARPKPAPGAPVFDYVESTFARTYTGQARAQQIDLQTGNFILALGMYVNNGDTNLSPADNLLTNISLMINGATSIQGPVSFQDLQDENQQRYNAYSPYGLADYNSTIASTQGVQALQGFALMSLIRNGDWNTSLNSSRQAGTDSVKLLFDTPASTGTDPATYTNPLQVQVHSHEIRAFTFTS